MSAADGCDSAARLGQFKNKSKDSVEMRRRRAEATVELRKAKREEHLLKRRNVLFDGGLVDDEPADQWQEHWTVEQIVAGANSPSLELQMTATKEARRLLSRELDPPFDEVIEAGLIPRLVSFLALSHCQTIQLEAAWALTNIAAGSPSQTASVVEAGAVPGFVSLVSSPNRDIGEQAVWALGNIAGDCTDFRDCVIGAGILPPLLSIVAASSENPSLFPPSCLANAVWTMSNLCHGKDPTPPSEAVAQMLPVLAQLLQHHSCYSNRDVLVNTMWALTHLTDGSNHRIQEVVAVPGLVPGLVELLAAASSSPCDDSQLAVLCPALRAVGNIVTGTDEQTWMVLEAGALGVFPELLRHQSQKVRKEAAWTLSNVTAGTRTQIQLVVNAGLMPLLVHLLQPGRADIKTQKEAAWAVANFTKGGSEEQTAYMLRETHLLAALPGLLGTLDAQLVKVVLEAIGNMLAAADRLGQVEALCSMLEESGTLDKMEELQNHQNHEVYEAVYLLIDRYFSTEEPPTEDQSTALDPTGHTLWAENRCI